MKIRTGFVSNSSSSSFCVYGFWLDDKKLEALGKTYDDMEAMSFLKGITAQRVSGEGYCVGVGHRVNFEENWETLDLEAYVARKSEVAEIAKTFGVENPDIKLHIGTYYS